MITVTFAKKSDQKRWDTYVSSHADAWPYHLYAWKNAIEKAYAHKAYYLIAEENQKIVGVLPLIHLQFPGLVNELTALPYCDVGNCLYDEEKAYDLILTVAVKLGEKLAVDKIHLRGGQVGSDRNHLNLVNEANDKVRMFLDLPKSADILLASFKSKLRSQIRKAEKNGVHFQWGNIENINEYYSVFSGNMRDLGSPVHSRRLFKAILENYGDAARLGLVIVKGKCIGGLIILTMASKVSIPWASTLRKYNRLAPNMLLYWNFLKYSCDSGFNHFDFGRSSNNEGTYRFKYQWGARPTALDWYSVYLKDPGLYKNTSQSSSLRETFEKMWQKMPLPAANFLGPLIRKHISL